MYRIEKDIHDPYVIGSNKTIIGKTYDTLKGAKISIGMELSKFIRDGFEIESQYGSSDGLNCDGYYLYIERIRNMETVDTITYYIDEVH